MTWRPNLKLIDIEMTIIKEKQASRRVATATPTLSIFMQEGPGQRRGRFLRQDTAQLCNIDKVSLQYPFVVHPVHDHHYTNFSVTVLEPSECDGSVLSLTHSFFRNMVIPR